MGTVQGGGGGEEDGLGEYLNRSVWGTGREKI